MIFIGSHEMSAFVSYIYIYSEDNRTNLQVGKISCPAHRVLEEFFPFG